MNNEILNIFRVFVDELRENKYNIEDMSAYIRTVIDPITDALHIGYFSSLIKIPYLKTYQTKENVLFKADNDNYDLEKAYEYQFIIGEFSADNASNIICAPVKGYEWDEEESRNVRFFIQTVVLLCSKAHLSGIVRHAYEQDVTTGIPNMAGVTRYIKELAVREDKSNYSLLYTNIKDFKLVNKTLGSKNADLVLIEYSLALRKFVKDGIVGRLGGDNYITIISNKNLKEYVEFLKAVTVDIETNDGQKHSITLQARSGIFPIDNETHSYEYIHCASAAYNHAKMVTKEDACWFTPDILSNEIYKKEITNALPIAIENKEFIVFYQPKIDLKDMTLCGGEALVRWKRNGVIIPPMEFIPIIESDGTVCVLDFFVLDEVCRQLREWIDKGITPVPISVNFSKAHLQNLNLVNDVLATIDKYGIDHSLIEIEVTELSDYDSYDILSSFINSMTSNGIKISIDDFGTGYSSINLLKNAAISTIKLDRSMLFELFSENKNTAIIIKNIIQMANELNMDVVAEGVENKEHADFLAKANCNKAQGYLFDRPMPADDFEYRLVNKNY